ncbi:response regulator [Paenibacillus donghaensis]|uniref:DNA-binding response regulator n=1 Tax=Paenibacillus donghaensis TaxID=414771 RepID=A0A2Z2KGA1_9BACL|nr:response regulator [Paenibacillus donghaensis]ASA25204.1 hypothetical protein B9T62_33410 [Paenibacillus donghaensis]
MLTMIIADDEPFIRSSLVKVFKWREEFGIEIVAEAADGQEAYDLCLQHQPDILFTDIMMPLLDGLQVAEKLKAAGSATKIIIISGAQDFAYAQSAMKVNAEGYILKPVKLNEVRDIFRKVIDRLHHEHDTHSHMEQLKQQLQENMPLLREKFLQNLLSGLYWNEEDIWDKIDYFALPFQRGEPLTVGVLQLDDYQTAIDKFSEEYKQLLYFSIQNIISECLASHGCGICCVANENEFVLLFSRTAAGDPNADADASVGASSAPDALSAICEQIAGNIQKYLRLTVSVGIGRTCEIGRLESSYKEALSALVYKFYTGHSSILHIKDIQPDTETLESTFVYKFHTRLMNELKVGHKEQVRELIESLFSRLAQPKLHIDYVQSICAELIFTAARTLYEIVEETEAAAQSRLQLMNSLYAQQNITELKAYMLSLFDGLVSQVAHKNASKNSRTILAIKKLVQEGYAQELSISRIAEEVFLTPNYISLIFKKETGETITDYITGIRIGKAKELLLATDLKVMEISERVGYENPHYFSTVFKKTTGVHPLKFRSGQ